MSFNYFSGLYLPFLALTDLSLDFLDSLSTSWANLTFQLLSRFYLPFLIIPDHSLDVLQSRSIFSKHSWLFHQFPGPSQHFLVNLNSLQVSSFYPPFWLHLNFPTFMKYPAFLGYTWPFPSHVHFFARLSLKRFGLSFHVFNHLGLSCPFHATHTFLHISLIMLHFPALSVDIRF